MDVFALAVVNLLFVALVIVDVLMFVFNHQFIGCHLLLSGGTKCATF